MRIPDLIAVVLYLALMIGVGLFFARKNKTTEQYFVGNRSFPGWVIGLSMLGTIVSSATFIALPAAAFILDWRQLTVNLMLPFVAVIAVVFFIPFFRRGKMTTAFEYLQARYGTIPRMYGTGSFIVLQLIRMAQVLFLVSLPIQFLTGAPLWIVIVAAGVFIGFYTIAGGIEAVIWTDVLQALILIVGGVLCLVIIIWDLPEGLGQILEVGKQYDKFSLGSFGWDLTERTFWTVAILGLINWLTIYAGDQNMVQRYAAAKSTREARKATLIFSVVALPMWTMFFFVGTALFVYYLKYPDPVVAGLEPDQVLPHFILTRVPAGVAGLVVAAIVAAAMSSLDSGINAISTVTVVDIMKPHLARGREDAYYLKAARLIAVVVTLIVVLGALAFSDINKESMNDLSLIVTSVFGGCLMGLFLMGFLTKRVDGKSAVVALVFAISFNLYLGLGLLGILPEGWKLPVHSYWTGALVNGAFVLIAYAVSFFRKSEISTESLRGLTVWTMGPSKGEIEE
jgi:SSS family solute:Na+ symporter